jgi:ribosomal-protein-alanine N-acetyltransferase
MSAIEICKLRPGDIREILAIAEAGRLSPWSHRDYMDELARTDSLMLTAVTGDGLAGFIVARRVPASGDDGGRDLEIYNIGVVPELYRKGIGGALMNEIIAISRRDRIRSIWLEVRASNERAIRFYEYFGFQIIASRRSFYRDPTEDGLTMKLELI